MQTITSFLRRTFSSSKSSEVDHEHQQEDTPKPENEDVEKARTPENGDVEKARTPSETTREDNDESQYPPLKVVLPAMFSIYLTVFLSSLDRTIIGVAIPAISDHFKSFDDIAWYEAAYLLSFATLQLPTGKLYTFFPAKWVYIILLVVFELGSLVCAAAPSSAAFIVGRVIAGIGGTGALTGAAVIMVDLLPLRKRPKYQGFLGAAFGVASVLGPLLGGVFTTKVTWRWCFWINLPIGGIAFVVLLFVLPLSPPPADNTQGTLKQKLARFDPFGNIFLIPGLACLIFALQWGGTKLPWSNARIVALLTVGSVFLVFFALIQLLVKDNGTVPPGILCQRSIAASVAVSIGVGAILIVATFYMPIWYQAIRGLSAVDAGYRLIPYFLGAVVFVITSGIVISLTGYYTPWLIVGTAVLMIGFGLWTTFTPSSSNGQLIGYQVIVGAGIGLSLQQTINAAQTVLEKKDIPVGITLLTFTQFFSGTLFVSVCQTILSNTLSSRITKLLPGFNVSAIASSGATEIRNLLPANMVPAVLEVYNLGLIRIFDCALALASLAFIRSLFMEWRSVKK